MPLDHPVGVELLQAKHAGRGCQRVRGRHPARVERLVHAGSRCRGGDAGGRDEADELTGADAGSSRSGLLHDPLHEEMRRSGTEVEDVRGDLHGAAAQEEPERLDPRQTTRRLAYGGGHFARVVERPPVQDDVEREERRANPDEHGARARIELPRPVRRFELAALDAPLERGRPAAPVERRAAPLAKRPVEEDGQPELVPDAPRDGARDRFRALEVLPGKRHHGNDVCRSHSRMDPVVPPEVDRAARFGDARDETVLERPLVSEQREHRAVVVRVEVPVDEAGTESREPKPDRRDDAHVASLGDVRDGLEREHLPTLETVREPTAPAYYDRRASEYDDWYLGVGLYRDRERPGFDDELAQVAATLTALPPARTLDVACGTGFLTRHLRGDVTGLDASGRMLAIAAGRVPVGRFVQGDALALPFPDDAFERLVGGHFYGHLDVDQRVVFLREARRVAPELVLVDASRAQSPVDEEWSERLLRDGSRWEVYKRYFEPSTLLEELGGVGEVLLAGDWFVVVRSVR